MMGINSDKKQVEELKEGCGCQIYTPICVSRCGKNKIGVKEYCDKCKKEAKELREKIRKEINFQCLYPMDSKNKIEINEKLIEELNNIIGEDLKKIS